MRYFNNLVWILYFSPLYLQCQDTDFLRKHIFTAPVRDVFKSGNIIYVKTGDGLYKREGEKWVTQKASFTKPYVFYDKDFYESEFIPNEFLFNGQSMSYLIPQKSIKPGTMAQVDNRLYVSVGGSLFEYAVNKYYSHFYKEFSIRDIYLEKNFKVVSTYDGIYINDSVKVTQPSYSSGNFCKVNGKYFLCNDELFAYQSPYTFRKIESAVNVFAGLCRKLLEFNGKIYTQNTKSINLLDSAFEITPIHQGYEYNDLEAVDSALLFCTNTGEVFQYDGKNTKLLFDLNSRIRDIYKFNNTVYLSTDAGLYVLWNLHAGAPTLLTNLPFCVKVVIDLNNNIWIATENGLYIIPAKGKEPIPFIKGVEFNRCALTYFEDNIYAGSISGLYVINTYAATRDFLPQYINKKNISEAKDKTQQIIFVTAVTIILIAAVFIYYYYKRQRKAILVTNEKDPGLTLDMIEEDIRNNKLMTVDGLAEYYKTNPVQLNRLFKNFETTPGKFMKKVKLNFARELLKNGVAMEDVVIRVGYSASYLKQELNV
jgi:AraC-like DNA-binding protein